MNARKKIRLLKTATLSDALREMKVGETALPPEGYSAGTLMKTCCELKEEGYRFRTSRSEGRQTVTRLQ